MLAHWYPQFYYSSQFLEHRNVRHVCVSSNGVRDHPERVQRTKNEGLNNTPSVDCPFNFVTFAPVASVFARLEDKIRFSGAGIWTSVIELSRVLQ